MEMVRNNIRALLAKYILSAVAATLVSGLYEVVDGIFVGQKMGMAGLAAITLAYPAATVIMAAGSMLAAGSGCLTALRLGSGDSSGARHAIRAGLSLWLLLSLFFTFAGMFFAGEIVALLGAAGHLQPMARDYVFWFSSGSSVVIGSLFLDSLLRNSGRPVFAMSCMVGGAIMNILLDALAVMVFDFGMTGVALATVFSQVLVCVAMLTRLLRSGTLPLPHPRAMHWRLSGRIVWVGMAAFSGTAALGAMMLLNNLVISRYGGEFELSIFGIMNYVLTLALLVFMGISLGIQPLIGCNFGAGRFDRVADIVRSSMKLALLVGVAMTAVLLLGREPLIAVFNNGNPQLASAASSAFCWYFPSIAVVGMVFVVAGYFQAIGHTGAAHLLLLGKYCLFVLPGLLLLPGVMGINGIWLATPSGDVLAILVAFVLLWLNAARLRSFAKAVAHDADEVQFWGAMVLRQWLGDWCVCGSVRGFRPVILRYTVDPAPDPCR